MNGNSNLFDTLALFCENEGLLPKHLNMARQDVKLLDLGHGDGRILFTAGRLGYGVGDRGKLIGIEINPLLWVASRSWQLTQPSAIRRNCDLRMGNLWKENLSEVDVLIVYGLFPIMNELGSKVRGEMKEGSIVCSNVFKFPNWVPIDQKDNVYVYRVGHGHEGGDSKGAEM